MGVGFGGFSSVCEGTDDDGAGGGPFDSTLLEGWAAGLGVVLGVVGMLWMTLSCRSTNDSFGAG